MLLFRLLRIIGVSLRFGLDEFILGHERVRVLRWPLTRLLFWRRLEAPRGERLRLALEALGPIFVKFGQLLSTRRDLLPTDIADELAKLQDQVPPFGGEHVAAALERAYRRPLSTVFAEFDAIAIASASVAQVHLARLHDGREVAVKILRPGIGDIIGKDVALLDAAASLVELLWADGRRLRPHEVVAEFAKHLEDELDLIREAANASQLRRNFQTSPLLLVPEVHWDYCSTEVMVMQRMHGTPVSQVSRLREQGIDMKQLSRAGVEIFFTQVFRDGFFHADMHPGNILVTRDGRYVALDFGIMGSLTPFDKHYLAQNFLAFFRRDYRRVAEAHIESGWVPKDTRADEFESRYARSANRYFPGRSKTFRSAACCCDCSRPRAGSICRCSFNWYLQKTLLNIEGLGRELDPHLDLWAHCQAVSGALDVGTDRLARPFAQHTCRGARMECAASADSPSRAWVPPE